MLLRNVLVNDSLIIGKRDLSGDLKIATVTPIFKGGDRSELGHSRPISVSPMLFQNT